MAGIYLHIPFCKQACHYCDFHFSTSLKYRTEMVQALAQEVALQKDYLLGETVETIYFGGGTPSLLNADEIQFLLDAISRNHHIADGAEITLEANPDDLGFDRIKALRQTPVNRLSIGIQSFFDEDLQWMNRAHRSQEAETAIRQARDAGLHNLTADLIYGYPLLTHDKWQHNMNRMLQLGIPHLSAYSMTVEPKTALAAFIKKKQTPPVSDAQSAEQFVMLTHSLQAAGYEHYEISNFCLPGRYSRHNSNYWKGVPYLGIGPSAHSFNGQTRQWNVANNALYLKSLAANELPAELETLTTENRLNEYIMTSLRTAWGLDLQQLDKLQSGASPALLKQVQPFLTKDWIFHQNGTLYLTPSGKLYADYIAAELFF